MKEKKKEEEGLGITWTCVDVRATQTLRSRLGVLFLRKGVVISGVRQDTAARAKVNVAVEEVFFHLAFK